MKYIWYMFLPILIVVCIQYAVIIGDVIILFLSNLFSHEDIGKETTVEFIMNRDYNQPMNKAYMTLVQYVIYILVFGIWYFKAFCNNGHEPSSMTYIKSKLLNLKTILLILGGYAAQLFVDGVLTLIAPYFKNQFEDYGKLVDSITGVGSSWVLLFAVIIVAPIGEELLFRGVIQNYGLKNFAPVLAIGLQGLVFGLYHGNIIQGIYAFFMGAVLGFVAQKLGSIIYPMVLHISINASLLLVPEVLYQGTLRTTLTTIVSGVIFAVMLWFAMKKKKNREQMEIEKTNPNS